MASIAVIGGTGALGKGIARRLVKAGHEVTIGSRSADKAQGTAEELGAAGYAANAEAAEGKDIVIVTVPHSSQPDTLARTSPHQAFRSTGLTCPGYPSPCGQTPRPRP